MKSSGLIYLHPDNAHTSRAISLGFGRPECESWIVPKWQIGVIAVKRDSVMSICKAMQRRDFIRQLAAGSITAAATINNEMFGSTVSSQERRKGKPLSLAGDSYYEFAIAEIERAADRLQVMADLADLAAERIVNRGGGLLASVPSFGIECVGRSGGIAFAKLWKPDESLRSQTGPQTNRNGVELAAENSSSSRLRIDDVLLLGFEKMEEENAYLDAFLSQALQSRALILLFVSEESARKVQARLGAKENLRYVTHGVPDGGILQVAGCRQKICSGRSFAQSVNLWSFQSELIGAFLRKGKMPGILLSATYESPPVFNVALLESYRFVPAFEVTPITKTSLGSTYLSEAKAILGRILPGQREKFREAARWMAESIKNGCKVHAMTGYIHGGFDPAGLPVPSLFTFHTNVYTQHADIARHVSKGDAVLFVGHNWYPPELGEIVDRAGGKLIACIALVHNLPPKPVLPSLPSAYGTSSPLFHPTSFDQLPNFVNHLYIDLKFTEYDGILKLPEFPVLANPTSQLAMRVVFWHLFADTMEQVLQI
jgi:hypothetical protein